MRTLSLLPHLRHIKVTDTLVTDHAITLVATTTRKRALCPLCRRWSKRAHSYYGRTIRDLPWAGCPVVIRLQVRRFFCDNPRCERRIFAERVPDLAPVRGRLALPFRRSVADIGLALGARAGACLAAPLGLPVSPRTVLRVLHALPEPEVPTPRVLGLDDFSFRRRRVFGTVLVDLETRRVVDLLPDRSIAVVSDWLRRHPGVEIAARDRNGSYAEGVRQGAPDAIQVIDRFHLMRNLVEALERLLLRHGEARERATATLTPSAVPRPLAPWEQRAEETSRRKHAPRVTTYERVWAMRLQGHDIAHIARTVGISRQTAYRYLAMSRPPERKRTHERAPRPLDAYLPYLRHRWEEGCRNANQLWREIRAMGYAQSSRTLALLMTEWRRQDAHGTGHLPRRRTGAAWTARQVAFLFIALPGDLTTEQARYLAALRAAEPSLAPAYAHAQDFAVMLRGRHGQRLDDWVARVVAGDCAELRAFATGLLPDKDAVEAGLTLPWSTGPCEGHIHKIKLIKRSMFGRAGFALLRQRVLRSAGTPPSTRATPRPVGRGRVMGRPPETAAA
jgi:transposase